MLRNHELRALWNRGIAWKHGTKDEEVKRIAGKIFITRAYRRLVLQKFFKVSRARATIQDTIPHDNTKRKQNELRETQYPTVDDVHPSYRESLSLFQLRNFRITYTYNLCNISRERSVAGAEIEVRS